METTAVLSQHTCAPHWYFEIPWKLNFVDDFLHTFITLWHWDYDLHWNRSQLVSVKLELVHLTWNRIYNGCRVWFSDISPSTHAEHDCLDYTHQIILFAYLCPVSLLGTHGLVVETLKCSDPNLRMTALLSRPMNCAPLTLKFYLKLLTFNWTFGQIWISRSQYK